MIAPNGNHATVPSDTSTSWVIKIVSNLFLLACFYSFFLFWTWASALAMTVFQGVGLALLHIAGIATWVSIILTMMSALWGLILAGDHLVGLTAWSSILPMSALWWSACAFIIHVSCLAIYMFLSCVSLFHDADVLEARALNVIQESMTVLNIFLTLLSCSWVFRLSQTFPEKKDLASFFERWFPKLPARLTPSPEEQQKQQPVETDTNPVANVMKGIGDAIKTCQDITNDGEMERNVAVDESAANENVPAN